MRSRKLILTIALMACMGGLAAQSDGFFSSGGQGGTREITEMSGNSMEVYGTSMGSSTEGYTTPLGSGLAVLLTLGAGYAVARRRKNE